MPESQQPLNDRVLEELLGQLQPAPGGWQPVLGNEIESLPVIQRLAMPNRLAVLQETVNILSRCISPNISPTDPPSNQTGLVVGYVQSGKTLSFTALTALAKDNQYQLIIVVAGTKLNLVAQSRERLVRDLRLNSAVRRPWLLMSNPTLAATNHTAIRDALSEWGDPMVPRNELRTVLITVMKHWKHLSNLIEVLRNIPINNVPTLIIDDEGDQASLNNQVRNALQSTTYARLLELKSIIPHHSYLQYTATPQAPLLINIVDVLSPNFAEVLSPGADYIGGRDFFTPRSRLVAVIPPNEIPSRNNPINQAPPSLLRAMRLFFLGATSHLVNNHTDPNRSMMVHPSRLIYLHGDYCNWVRRAREGWLTILRSPEGSPDRDELLRQFEEDYADLRSTEPNIPLFDNLVPRLIHALTRTTVREVNGPNGTLINWTENSYWILVGGSAMDRGFTVEGLTVTYMPRGTGVGNADTIQQRGRFFGYKRGYRGYCRVFLDALVNNGFTNYVEHEEDIRNQLIACSQINRPLSEWRRQFFLNSALEPTRSSVIDIDFRRYNLGGKWHHPEGLHDVPGSIVFNRTLFNDVRSRFRFFEHDGLDKRGQRTHKNLMVRNVPLRRIQEEFLTRLSVRRLDDSRLFSAMLRLIQVYFLQEPTATCSLFLMSGGERIRRGYENDQIKQLFQGRQYANNKTTLTYPGDRDVKDDCVSIQMRYLDLQNLNERAIAENVPHVAIWIPANMDRGILQQPQGR